MKTAIERAEELVNQPYPNVPRRIRDYVDYYTTINGPSSIHKALSNYAEIVEGCPGDGADVEDYAYFARIFLDLNTRKIQKERKKVDAQARTGCLAGSS